MLAVIVGFTAAAIIICLLFANSGPVTPSAEVSQHMPETAADLDPKRQQAYACHVGNAALHYFYPWLRMVQVRNNWAGAAANSHRSSYSHNGIRVVLDQENEHMMNLNDKVIVITGAGSGIGRQLAVQFATENCRLALSDINQEGLDETVALLKLDPDKVASTIVDVSDRGATEAFAGCVMEKFGQVDVLINNAGLTCVGSIEDVSYEAFERVINVNMWGVVYGCRAFLPYLKQRPESVLANVSSINGMVPFIDNGPYNMSKYAVYGLNETLMLELRDTPVHLLSIHPGGIDTNIANSAIDAKEETKSAFSKLANTSPEQAAGAIVNAVKAKKRYLFIGRDAKFMQLLKRLSPRLSLRFIVGLTARVIPSQR